MPKIGELIELKVTKIIKTGAFLSDPKDRSLNFFLHIKEASNKKWLDTMEEVVKEGEKIKTRVVDIRDFNNKITYQVSLKDTKEAPVVTKEEDFKDKMDKFLKRSSERQSDIKKNQNRKFDGRKPKNKKNLK